jgi:hypothetical protein
MSGGYLDQLDEHLDRMRERRPLHVIVTGSRKAPDDWRPAVGVALRHIHQDPWRQGLSIELYQGAAPGVDRWATSSATALGWKINSFAIPQADWLVYGNRAGPLRNMRMVDAGNRWYGPEILRPYALCLAFIHHRSSGSTGCALYALSQGVPTVRIDDELILLPRMTRVDLQSERYVW